MNVIETECFTQRWGKSLELSDETINLLISNGFTTKQQLLTLPLVLNDLKFPSVVQKAAVTAGLKELIENENNKNIPPEGWTELPLPGKIDNSDVKGKTGGDSHNDLNYPKPYEAFADETLPSVLRKLLRDTYGILTITLFLSLVVMGILFALLNISDNNSAGRWVYTFIFGVINMGFVAGYKLQNRQITNKIKLPKLDTANKNHIRIVLLVYAMFTGLFLGGFASVNMEAFIYVILTVSMITGFLTLFSMQRKFRYNTRNAVIVSFSGAIVMCLLLNNRTLYTIKTKPSWGYSPNSATAYIAWFIFGIYRIIRQEREPQDPLLPEYAALLLYIGFSCISMFYFIFYCAISWPDMFWK